jgi:hypothetical protein
LFPYFPQISCSFTIPKRFSQLGNYLPQAVMRNVASFLYKRLHGEDALPLRDERTRVAHEVNVLLGWFDDQF